MDQKLIETKARELNTFLINSGYTEIKIHEYTDVNSVVLYWKIRLTNPTTGKKEIRPMSYQEDHWALKEPNLTGKKPLYGLDRLKDSTAVFFVEGESCADALGNLGLIATTSGGSSSFSSTDFEPLRNKTVYLWADNDQPGIDFMNTVSNHLSEIGCQVFMLNIKELNLPNKGDVVDWLKLNPEPTGQTILTMPYWQELSNVGATCSEESIWEPPMSILEDYDNEPYPKDCLPPLIKAAVDEVHAFVQSPYAMLASSAISAISLASQAYFDVQRAEKLEGPCSCYFLTIAESGERKSTGEGFFTQSIKEFERDKAEEAKPFIKEYKAKLGAWEAKCAGTKDKIRQETKAGKDTGNYERKLSELMSEKPEQAKVPRLIYVDATPEALAFSLFSNWPSGGLVSAEGGQVFGSHGMGTGSVMRNLAMLNQLWDGNTLHVDRRTSESFSLVGGRLTISIQIQEAALLEFLTATGNLARGTGFLARFLLVWPTSTQGNRFFKEAPKNWPNLNSFNQRLTEILYMPCNIDQYGSLKPTRINFSLEAKDLWKAHHDSIEQMLRVGGELSDIKDVASKSADNAARLAALFEVFTNPSSLVISKKSLESAQAIAAWHLSQSVRFFGQFSLPDETHKMVQLDEWLIKYCAQNQISIINKSILMQRGPNFLRKKNLLDKTLKDLIAKNRVRLISRGKTQLVEVNPALLEASHVVA